MSLVAESGLPSKGDLRSMELVPQALASPAAELIWGLCSEHLATLEVVLDGEWTCAWFTLKGAHGPPLGLRAKGKNAARKLALAINRWHAKRDDGWPHRAKAARTAP